MRRIAQLSVLVWLSLSTLSCSKKEVVGPAGPQGPTGGQGTPGTNGTNGTNGNANVISTNNVTTTNWTQESSNIYSKTLLVPAITQDIVDNGSVLVFYKDTDNMWNLLPLTIGKNITLYSFYLGKVDLLNYNTDFSANTNPGAKTYRIVVIASSN